ncbi:MAG: LPS export ABC transporter periplasmic protein LptC, partial [Burkholderiaceae bacterium]|nr:LPS export ABC transporter periplasmic protein LptC [Burkholderiaceae bacterium]
LAAALSVTLLLALAAGTYYLAQVSLRGAATDVGRAVVHEPDYFVEDALFTRINARGEPAFRISAERMLHFPDDQSTTYEMPVLVSLDPSRPPVTIRADQGRSSAGGEETLLQGNVVLVRAQTQAEPAMTIRTESVTVYSETEIARTDLPVRIERGESVLTGVGMEFNNAARSLKVDSRVQLTWQPPQPSP